MHRYHHEEIKNYFNDIAHRYDRINEIISLGLHQRWREEAIALLRISPGEHLLDVCCGSCQWTAKLSELVGSYGSVTGIDFSEKMLDIAADRTAYLHNVTLHPGDAQALPFPDGQFDYVLIAFGLRNTGNYRRVLQEMRRVLKPGGKIMCLETSKPASVLFRKLFAIYLLYLVPVIGELAGSNYRAYSWLGRSTFAFPDKEELANIFIQAGFSQVSYKQLSGGVAAIHLGTKSSNKQGT